MTADIGIYRTARVILDRHGGDTPIHAAMRADGLMDQGDMEGRAAWLRIKAAVEEMVRTKRRRVVH